jgi:hypothetical protein
MPPHVPSPPQMLTASKITPVRAACRRCVPIDRATPQAACSLALTAVPPLRVAGTSPICLNLGSDHGDDNILVEKINGAAANGVRIKFSQANPTSGSFTVDLVRASALLVGPSTPATLQES